MEDKIKFKKKKEWKKEKEMEEENNGRWDNKMEIEKWQIIT